jgi:hypothetical protein
MTYTIISLATGVPIESTDGPLTYTTGRDAAAAAADMTTRTGIKHQPRRAANDSAPDWTRRESARLASGEYTAPTWATAPWYRAAISDPLAPGVYAATEPRLRDILGVARDHYAHVSTLNPALLAYTQSTDKGARDIQTPIRPGAYLTQFFGAVLDAGAIRDRVREYNRVHAPNTDSVRFARSPAEIERAYTCNRLGSCMGYDASRYASQVHPVRVYGQPHSDLTVAYLEDSDGHLYARGLVWESKRLYHRLYGDAASLERELKTLGYTRGDFCGARVAKIPNGGDYIMPYIDCAETISHVDDGFIITECDGDYSCRSTNGLTAAYGICHNCGEPIDVDDAYTHADNVYCERCYADLFATCDRCGEMESNDDMHEVRARDRHDNYMTQHWCAMCADHHAFNCADSDELTDDSLVVTLANGDTISAETYENGCYCTCDATDEIYHSDDTVELTDGRTVSRDWYDDNEDTLAESGVYQEGCEPDDSDESDNPQAQQTVAA